MFSHFELLAPIYDRVIGGLLGPPDRGLWAEMLELPIGGRLLDAGGGTGRVSKPLRSLVGQLVVIDASYGMLRVARDKGGTNPVRADAALLPFGDRSFERIMVADALHHFPRQREVIRELARVLAPGGILVIEEFDLRRPAIKALALMEKLALMRSRFLRPEEIRSLLLETGLTAGIRAEGGFRAFVVAKKSGSLP